MSELNKHRNHGLFSDYYLNELLPQRVSEWQDHALIQKAFIQIKSLYENLKSSLPQQSESQLEEKFIKKILTILGHVYEVQPTLVGTAVGMKKPDYALFPNRQAQESVQNVKGKTEFFQQVLAIAEAKKWERPLDKEIKHIEDKDNPSLQMDRYLYYTEVPWGILTNGRYWRLYNRKTSKELDNYFEVDLQQVLEAEDIEAFKYFYFFFRREAFPEFVEQVYQGSVDYAKELGDNLKENVYDALKILARGFLKTPRNNLDPEKDLKEIHDNCLILLYRIIFLLYAESPRRGERLLPLDDPVYQKQYSIYALKNKVRDLLTQKAELSPIKATLWSELKALFALVNQGSESMGILKDKFFVPAYNGGLFDEREHEFLEKYVIADLYLAQAIDMLARTPVRGNYEKAFADYGSLQIRHLGSIYEGLLEYKLGIAKEKMVAISEKGKQKWVKASEAKGKKAIEEVEAGDIYLYTDKGERKATGSYYTPDYIVDYIVHNTLGPILEDLKKQVNGNSTKLIDAILNLKVLDPAMGSGHFLVAATDYLARALVEALGESEKELEEDDIRWARREIVERCIFGVDLNPLAVELAKLSLWLATVSKNKPLSFLDHHLRCGNSLIGATIKNLADLPEIGKKKKRKKGTGQQLTLLEIIFKKEVNELLNDFERIESLPSETVKQIRDKEKLYEDFRIKVDRFKIVADIWTSRYFGNDLILADYKSLQEGLQDEEKWQELAQKEWFQKGVEIAEEKRFFHWELEFPEVFFGTGREPGFDAVIGNPPYVMELRENKELFRELQISPIGQKYYEAKMDLFYFFIEHGIDLLKENARLGFIVQEYWVSRAHASKLRKKIFEDTIPRILVDFKGFQVFKDATGQHNMIVLFEKSKDKGKTVILSLKHSDMKEEDVIKALALEPERQDAFEVRKREASELYNTTTDKVYLSESEMSDLQIKLAERSFNLKDEEIQIGADVHQPFLRAGAISKLPNPTNHQPGEGIFVLSKDELKKFKWTNDEQEILKPFHYAEELEKFSYAGNTEHYLIYTPKEVARDIEENPSKYPNIKAHLDKYQKVITSDNKPYGIHRARQPEWFEDPQKIIGVRKVKYPTFVIVPEPYYMDQSVLIIRLASHKAYSPYFCCAVLNSKLAYSWFSQQKRQGEQLQIDKEVLLHFPIRRIFFTTLASKLQQVVSRLQSLYGREQFGKLLGLIEGCLPKDNNGNFLVFTRSISVKEAITKGYLSQEHAQAQALTDDDPSGFDTNGNPLEHSDVIHDLLAYLAEQMIEMNKQKNQEIKGFLAWLENYLGVKIDDLKNKTKIREYHEGTIELLLEVLDQNRKAITKINIQGREAREQIKTEFEKSIAKLKPLKDRIEVTDKLIDQIVYKLYGLTDEEIKIVEGSLSSHPGQTEDGSPEDD
ncbi:MAG: N-6 DNA methylase [Candidatus Methanomethylicaceae archaeon]